MRRWRASELLSLKGCGQCQQTCTPLIRTRLAYLTALLAPVRLLAGVHPGMHCQSGALDELLSATRKVAAMRPDATVDTLCSHISGNQQRKSQEDIPWRARSLRLANGFPQVAQGYGFAAGEPAAFSCAGWYT